MAHSDRLAESARQNAQETVHDRYDGLSGVARRKLQNRLNQRKCRERKRQLLDKADMNPNRKWIIYYDANLGTYRAENGRSDDTQSAGDAAPAPLATGRAGLETSDGVLHFCRLAPTERNAFISRLRIESVTGASSHLLNLELLLSVKQYNIFIAMSTNAASLGLSMESLRHDIPSPFNTSMPWVMNVPPSLQPTALQKQTTHHPWIDLFPMPSVRDALLMHQGEYDDEELCHDLFGSCGRDKDAVGLLIWGEACDPLAYEISEKVARKWLWLLHDCNDVILSSNRWRAKRGERRLLITDCTSNSSPLECHH